jgi:hypothetical protein
MAKRKSPQATKRGGKKPATQRALPSNPLPEPDLTALGGGVGTNWPKVESDYLEIEPIHNSCNRGLFAILDEDGFIPAGTTLLKETPLIWTREESEDDQIKEAQSVFRHADRETQRKIAHLFYPGKSNSATDTVKERYIHNAKRSKKVPGWFVYYGISIINHSCNPNSFLSFNEDGKCSVINAIPISYGDSTEITINYSESMNLLSDPLERANYESMFTCICYTCQKKSPVNESNRMRARELVEKYDLESLTTFFGAVEANRTEERGMIQELEIEEAIYLLEKLQFFPLIANAYAAALYIYSHNEDEEFRQRKIAKYLFLLKDFKATISRETGMTEVNPNYSTKAFVFARATTILQVHVICKYFVDKIGNIQVPEHLRDVWKLVMNAPHHQAFLAELQEDYAGENIIEGRNSSDYGEQPNTNVPSNARSSDSDSGHGDGGGSVDENDNDDDNDEDDDGDGGGDGGNAPAFASSSTYKKPKRNAYPMSKSRAKRKAAKKGEKQRLATQARNKARRAAAGALALVEEEEEQDEEGGGAVDSASQTHGYPTRGRNKRKSDGDDDDGRGTKAVKL